MKSVISHGAAILLLSKWLNISTLSMPTSSAIPPAPLTPSQSLAPDLSSSNLPSLLGSGQNLCPTLEAARVPHPLCDQPGNAAHSKFIRSWNASFHDVGPEKPIRGFWRSTEMEWGGEYFFLPRATTCEMAHDSLVIQMNGTRLIRYLDTALGAHVHLNIPEGTDPDQPPGYVEFDYTVQMLAHCNEFMYGASLIEVINDPDALQYEGNFALY